MLEEKKMKILILEDNEDFVQDFSGVFEEYLGEAFQLVPATGVDQALMIAQSSDDFDLILIDLKLAGKDTGLDFAKRLQSVDLLSNVPKAIFSDLSRDDISLSGEPITYASLQAAGVSDFIEKKSLWVNGGVEALLERFQSLSLRSLSQHKFAETRSAKLNQKVSSLTGVAFLCAGVSAAYVAYTRLIDDPIATQGGLAVFGFSLACVGLAPLLTRKEQS